MGGVQGGAWVVFPASGEITAILSSERELRMWAANLFWPSDIRWGDFSKFVPDRLRELGLAKSRIGLTGLLAQYRMSEGTIPFETWRPSPRSSKQLRRQMMCWNSRASSKGPKKSA
jgi:hypothetical protein